MKIVFSYYFHNVPLYSNYSQREYLSSQINISNPFFHRPRVGGFFCIEIEIYQIKKVVIIMTTFMSVKLYTLNQDLFLNPSYGSISLCKPILALTQMSFNLC